MSIAKTSAVVALVAALSGCATSRDLYEGTVPASVGDLTTQNLALRNIPPPSHRQVVAVYELDDQTGQYKERDFVQSLSRAVTQGGTAVLISALQDAGSGQWFSVLDRSRLQSVLQERQIVERMREQYMGETTVDPDALGPLMQAGVILAGSIVGYDTNIQTGGYGARYLGIGANTEWKFDVVTVNLRALSTESGEVLANVVVRKPIASVKSQGDIFRFVELDELFEGEAGLSTNEPREVAVQQAVEKAVMSLIAEGVSRGLWSFRDEAVGRRYVEGYLQQLFNGSVPGIARTTTRPLTPNAAHIPRTIPVARPAVTEERRVPATQGTTAPPEPPPAANGEVLG